MGMMDDVRSNMSWIYTFAALNVTMVGITVVAKATSAAEAEPTTDYEEEPFDTGNDVAEVESEVPGPEVEGEFDTSLGDEMNEVAGAAASNAAAGTDSTALENAVFARSMRNEVVNTTITKPTTHDFMVF